jgi:hypothetical protein
MPKRITIAPHLSIEELQARFRQAKTTTQAIITNYLAASWRQNDRRSDAVTGYIAILYEL